MKNMGNDKMIDVELYDNLKTSNKILFCDNCGDEWELKTTDIKQTKIVPKDEVITLTYFTCPKCGKLYVVNIDNDYTLQLRNKLLLEIKRIKSEDKKGKDTSKRRKKVSSLYIKLKKLGDELKVIYNGTFYQKSTI